MVNSNIGRDCDLGKETFCRASTSNKAVVMLCKSKGSRLVVMIDTTFSYSAGSPFRIEDFCSLSDIGWPHPARLSHKSFIPAR